VLVDIKIKGKPVKAVVQANRNGFFYYALDRATGKLLATRSYNQGDMGGRHRRGTGGRT